MPFSCGITLAIAHTDLSIFCMGNFIFIYINIFIILIVIQQSTVLNRDFVVIDSLQWSSRSLCHIVVAVIISYHHKVFVDYNLKPMEKPPVSVFVSELRNSWEITKKATNRYRKNTTKQDKKGQDNTLKYRTIWKHQGPERKMDAERNGGRFGG